ncbi:MAG TPA: ABC transporter substrate-binding protein [Nitrososphaerales archaeon]|nr:ABC transporter substrate-binding protein [Nitrososphaerales archaeon]
MKSFLLGQLSSSSTPPPPPPTAGAITQPPRKGNRSKLLAIAIIVILIVGLIGGFYYYFYLSKPNTIQTPLSFALEGGDATHAATIDALNHLSSYNIKLSYQTITDPTALTSAGSSGAVDIFGFQFPTTTLNAIEKGANLVAIGEESTSFLQDLVVSDSIQTFQQLNGTTMAAFSLDGPVLFPLVFQSYGQNYSNYNINLVVIGDSSVKAQALIAGRYVGAFLDPEDAATVFKAAPGKFHILGTTAQAFPGIGGGVFFANKDWLKTHFQVAVDFTIAYLESVRNMTANLPAWIQSTYQKNFSGSNSFDVYNSTEYILAQSDYFSPNMITYTPSLMNASDYFLFYGGLINASGDVNQIYNFSVLQQALKEIGTVKEPAGPFQNNTPLAIFASIPANVAGIIGNEGLEVSTASRNVL